MGNNSEALKELQQENAWLKMQVKRLLDLLRCVALEVAPGDDDDDLFALIMEEIS